MQATKYWGGGAPGLETLRPQCTTCIRPWASTILCQCTSLGPPAWPSGRTPPGNCTGEAPAASCDQPQTRRSWQIDGPFFHVSLLGSSQRYQYHMLKGFKIISGWRYDHALGHLSGHATFCNDTSIFFLQRTSWSLKNQLLDYFWLFGWPKCLTSASLCGHFGETHGKRPVDQTCTHLSTTSPGKP